MSLYGWKVVINTNGCTKYQLPQISGQGVRRHCRINNPEWEYIKREILGYVFAQMKGIH
jgi:hypothetical protein